MNETRRRATCCASSSVVVLKRAARRRASASEAVHGFFTPFLPVNSTTLFCADPNILYTSTCLFITSASVFALASAAAASSPFNPAFSWNASRSLRFAYLSDERSEGGGGRMDGWTDLG